MTTPKEVVPSKVLIQNRTEGLNLITPLKVAVQAMTVTTEEEYRGAEVVLGRVDEALESWKGRMEPIIRPIRTGLDLLYALDRDVRKPLEDYRKQISGKMGIFLTQKRMLEIEASRKAQAELDRLRREEEVKAAKAESIKSNALRDKLNQKRAEIQQQVKDIEEAQAEQTTFKGESTFSRDIKTWTVVDMKALLKHILESDRDLTSLVEVNMTQVKALYTLDNANPKTKPPSASEWIPGIALIETVGVSKRKS